MHGPALAAGPFTLRGSLRSRLKGDGSREEPNTETIVPEPPARFINTR